jgi:hypothetical protein
MNDRPTAPELVTAARDFLEKELLPTVVDPRLRFQALVTAHVLSIVARELVSDEEHLLWEWEWLGELLDSTDPAPPRLAALRQGVYQANKRLCHRIQQGDFDDGPLMLALLKQLRRTVDRKLEVANPRYLSGAQTT